MYLDEKLHTYVTLPKVGSWPQADHVFEEDSLWAINAALASHRPLLLSGEPGTGKSQLARAAAAALGRVPLSFVVNARTESRDLQYHYDALARLAEAQTATLTKEQAEKAPEILEKLHPGYFLEPGILWWAFAWDKAKTQFEDCHSRGQAPEVPDPAVLGNGKVVTPHPSHGTVVLIDEIDKADADVPSGLLETLGNGGFSVPYVNQAVRATEPFPLVILTTNGDRELPPAFLRRCLTLKMVFPATQEVFVKRLAERGEKRYGKALDEDMYTHLAEILWEDRTNALEHQLTGPGQAEYFDMLQALVNLQAQKKLTAQQGLKRMRRFIFQKYASEPSA